MRSAEMLWDAENVGCTMVLRMYVGPVYAQVMCQSGVQICASSKSLSFPCTTLLCLCSSRTYGLCKWCASPKVIGFPKKLCVFHWSPAWQKMPRVSSNMVSLRSITIWSFHRSSQHLTHRSPRSTSPLELLQIVRAGLIERVRGGNLICYLSSYECSSRMLYQCKVSTSPSARGPDGSHSSCIVLRCIVLHWRWGTLHCAVMVCHVIL